MVSVVIQVTVVNVHVRRDGNTGNNGKCGNTGTAGRVVVMVM